MKRLLLLALLAGCTQTDTPFWECQFVNNNTLYVVSDFEMHRSRSLLIVTNPDGRVHAFPRKNLRVCRSLIATTEGE